MNAAIEALKVLYEKDLGRLSKEINAYQNEKYFWILEGTINNTGGNLCLHICGNLQHFFGSIIGKSSYVRNRDDEFNLKNIPKSELLSEIEKAREAVILGFDNLDESLLDQTFPVNVFDYDMTYSYFITSLYAHLSFHMGQINYHRRILSKS